MEHHQAILRPLAVPLQLFHLQHPHQPAVRDRVNCVNSRLRNNDGESHLTVHPKCKELIRDLEQVTWSFDPSGLSTSEIKKSDRLRTHSYDALGYSISQAFLPRGPIGHQPAGRIL